MSQLLTDKVSLVDLQDVNKIRRKSVPSGNLAVHHFLVLLSALTLASVALDQFAAPILRTTSPLWAITFFLLLVWRRGNLRFVSSNDQVGWTLSISQLAVFFTTHLVLIQFARAMTGTLQPVAYTHASGGLLVAVSKLSVLCPTLVLLPFARLKELVTAYKCEIIVALVVFATFSPWRTMEAVWPWYGQLLGQFVYTLAQFFVAGLGYVKEMTPTIVGPQLDITIMQPCSGIAGFELFGYLFGFVTILDWNRLRKGRTLFAYFSGLFAVLLGNALRITSFVVFGNRGFADFVLRFHVSSGLVFFSIVFLAYLSLTYGWMLNKENLASSPVA